MKLAPFMSLRFSRPRQHSRSATFPIDRVYWAVLDAPNLRASGPLPLGLLPALADEMPIAVAELHAVFTPLPRNAADSVTTSSRVLVCAAERSAMPQLIASASATAEHTTQVATSDVADEVRPGRDGPLPDELARLTPETLPAELNVGPEVDLSQLNLLVGEFEPASHRQARARRHTVAASTTLACALLAALGLWRRGSHDLLAARENARAADAVVTAQAPKQREDLLLARRNALIALSAAVKTAKPPNDAAETLAHMLRAWPVSVPAKPQSIAISSENVSISVSMVGDVAPFLKAFTAPAGWRLDEPRVNRSDVLRVSLLLRRAPIEKPSEIQPSTTPASLSSSPTTQGSRP